MKKMLHFFSIIWIYICFYDTVPLKACANVLRSGRWLSAVYTVVTLPSIILRGDSEKYEYLSENETIFETILTYWSVAQAGSNDEKKLEVEILVGLSL